MEPSAVKTSLTPDSEDDIQVLHSSIVQEVHAVPNFQNNTKDNLYVRDIPAFNIYFLYCFQVQVSIVSMS